MQATIPERKRFLTSTSIGRSLVVIPCLLAIAYVAIGGIAAYVLTVPKRQFTNERNPGQFNVSYENVRFPARGNDAQIAGWYIPHETSTRALIIVHGKDASRTEEFAGSLTEFGASLKQSGYNVLMIDLRGHGQSSEGRYSFGLIERRDVQGAVDWLSNRGFKPGNIGVLGISLGAASAVGATAEDSRIGALATDSAFAEFCPVLQRNWVSNTGLPEFLVTPTVLMTRVLFGIDLCAAQPVREFGKIAPRPVLLIHSTGDQLVPVANVYALKASAQQAETWVIAGAEHARIYNADTAEYTRRVADFFDRGLNK